MVAFCLRFAIRSARSWLPGPKGRSICSSECRHDPNQTPFDYTGWWDPLGPAKGLHSMNSLRVPLIRDALLRNQRSSASAAGRSGDDGGLPLRGARILDVGCGAGILSEPLARLGASVTGIDEQEECIEMAREHASLDARMEGRLLYEHRTLPDRDDDSMRSRSDSHSQTGDELSSSAEATSPPMAAPPCNGMGEFDLVVASEVVEHVRDVPRFVGQCCDRVGPGGHVVFTTFNRTPLSFLLGIVAAEYLLGLVPLGTHKWKDFVVPSELSAHLERNGMVVERCRGMTYNPFANSWRFVDSTSVNYVMVAKKT